MKKLEAEDTLKNPGLSRPSPKFKQNTPKLFLFPSFLKKIDTNRIDVGLFGGNAGLFKPYGVRGVIGNAGVSGRGDVSVSVSDRYDENDSSRT